MKVNKLNEHIEQRKKINVSSFICVKIQKQQINKTNKQNFTKLQQQKNNKKFQNLI